MKRTLLETNANWVEKRIAILGGLTTSNIKVALELFLLNQGIKPCFYESEYNQYYQDAIFSNPELNELKPEIIYIHTSNRNITSYPLFSDSSSTVDELLNLEFDKFQNVWQSLTDRFHCPIIQNNFEMPIYRLMGNKDASDIHGAVNFLSRLNMRFYEYAQTHEDFFICDINYISVDFGLKEWSDPFYWYMYKYSLNVSAIPLLLIEIAELNKVILMEAIKTVYVTAYSRLLLLVKTRKIGQVVSVDATCTSLTSSGQVGNNKKWGSLEAWGPTALLPVLQIFGDKYESKHIFTIRDKEGYDEFTKIDFTYPSATVKVGTCVKFEGELIISGRKGYIYVPAPWWKTDYFEIRYENPAANRRYFYQVEGEGIRYELVALANAIRNGKGDYYINRDTSKSISKIMEDYNNI